MNVEMVLSRKRLSCSNKKTSRRFLIQDNFSNTIADIKRDQKTEEEISEVKRALCLQFYKPSDTGSSSFQSMARKTEAPGECLVYHR